MAYWRQDGAADVEGGVNVYDLKKDKIDHEGQDNDNEDRENDKN